MTRRPDLDSVLAITAAAVAGIAVIVGFVIVGGPGQARDRRLDELTSQRISQIVGVVQCAFDASGVAPIDYATAAKTRGVNQPPNQPSGMCDGRGYGSGVMDLRVGQGDAPTSPGDITYLDTGPAQAKICGNFRTKAAIDSASFVYPFSDVYPTLGDPHPAGVHCYTLDLVRSGPAGVELPSNSVPNKPPEFVP